MVQSADPVSREDHGCSRRRSLHWTAQRSVLGDPKMSPVLVVVGPELGEQAPKVLLVENDDVVEQLPAYRTDQTFGDLILPGAPVAGSLGGERHGGRRAITSVEKAGSQSKRRYFKRLGATSKEKASRSCWTTHAADGDSVTLQCRTWRRACPMANHT